jgi:hypothetical protein
VVRRVAASAGEAIMQPAKRETLKESVSVSFSTASSPWNTGAALDGTARLCLLFAASPVDGETSRTVPDEHSLGAASRSPP